MVRSGWAARAATSAAAWYGVCPDRLVLLVVVRDPDGKQRDGSFFWLAALGATVLIWTGGLLFLLQAAHLGRFNALYGALGSIVAFLLRLYLSSCVGVFGVCFCAAQTEVRENANDHPEKHPE